MIIENIFGTYSVEPPKKEVKKPTPSNVPNFFMERKKWLNELKGDIYG